LGYRLGYMLDNRGTVDQCPAEAGGFALVQKVQTSSGNYPAHCLMSATALYPDIRRLSVEADHSPPSSTEVKKMSMNGVYVHSPPLQSCCAEGQVHG
jgi:hypothetical protein